MERPGPPDVARVVTVHGGLDRASSFLRTERHLPDLTVVRYDRRGYARSLDAGPAVDFDQQVDDLVGVVDGRPSVVVGHSFGGLLALALAGRRPDLVRAVLVYEAPMPWLGWWPLATPGQAATRFAETPAEAAERFMRALIGDEHWARLPAPTRQQRRAEGPALLADLASVRPPAPVPIDPATIVAPLVVASGGRSPGHQRRAAEEIAGAAPRGERHEIAGAGHGAHLSHPAELAALVRRAVALAGS
ncbi:MAG: alpha/beta fold hydrolase [Acidimicrobiia bacterium]